MAPLVGSKLKEKHTTVWMGGLAGILYPGEEVTTLAKTNMVLPLCDGLAITTARVMAFVGSDLGGNLKVRIEVSANDIVQVEVRSRRFLADVLIVTTRAGREVSFGTIQSADRDLVLGSARQLVVLGVPAEVSRAMSEQVEAASQTTSAWAQIEVIGRNPNGTAWKALKDHASPGETPWFVIGAEVGAGLFAAFQDRCMIVKLGAMTGLMTGTLGGGRITTFHYSEITGIEYNSGMINGVLEVLTPSYQGTANKDFWRGSNQSRNADSNDPWTLSNTLPVNKLLYQKALPRLNEMRAKIIDAKRPTIITNSPATAPPGGGFAEELGKLASLRDQGVLDESEFQAAKQAALTRYTVG